MRIRILFIGEALSSHFTNWLELFKFSRNSFDLRVINLFGCPKPNGYAPIHNAHDLTPLPGTEELTLVDLPKPEDWAGYVDKVPLMTPDALLNCYKIIDDFVPHIVHTLALFPGSMFYMHMLRTVNMRYKPLWLIQARGGPDLAFNKDNPHLRSLIEEMLGNCDYFMADTDFNYRLAREVGLNPAKVADTGPVPGTGGIDDSIFADMSLPSRKEKLILWPKAYFGLQSDGMPVVEALRTVLEQVPDARVVAAGASDYVGFWFNRMLAPYKERIELLPRIPHGEMMQLYRRARILLIPSLSDGIPNSLYEAMASCTVPIVSPIDTIKDVFSDGVHALFADNLYPEQLSGAMLRLLKDDALADRIAKTNQALFPSLAGKNAIRERVLPFYKKIVDASDTQEQFLRLEIDRLSAELFSAQQELASYKTELEKTNSTLKQHFARMVKRVLNR